MALPFSRDQTFTPNSPVPSAVLNDIQDAIIGEHTRTTGGVGAAISSALAITAPDYHLSAPRPRHIHGSKAHQMNLGGPPAAGDEWVCTVGGLYRMTSTSATPALLQLGLASEDGETWDVLVHCQHSVATAGAMNFQLAHIASNGAFGGVSSVASAAVTTPQTLSIVTGHAVVAGAFYVLIVVSAGGLMTRYFDGLDINWTR
jgi:hypothetical protein